MQVNILWTGREYYSLENGVVSISGGVVEVDSTIVGKYGDILYKVDYKITTNAHGHTVLCDVIVRHSDRDIKMNFRSNGSGGWTLNGKMAPEFEGCIDVDIPLTPFTNTLPIRRSRLTPGQETVVPVLYIDILGHRLSSLKQKYRRISENIYHYENIPNDFEADIEVDQDGLVVDYPELFVRTARTSSDYKTF
jgi:uncharacterized protein